MKRILIVLTISFLFTSCESDEDNQDGIICTEQFVTVGVALINADLTEWFTIRKSTNDTIQLEGKVEGNISIFYPILNDSFQPLLENTQEEFDFHGYEADELVINEPYIIGADECHIDIISGRTEIVIED